MHEVDFHAVERRAGHEVLVKGVEARLGLGSPRVRAGVALRRPPELLPDLLAVGKGVVAHQVLWVLEVRTVRQDGALHQQLGAVIVVLGRHREGDLLAVVALHDRELVVPIQGPNVAEKTVLLVLQQAWGVEDRPRRAEGHGAVRDKPGGLVDDARPGGGDHGAKGVHATVAVRGHWRAGCLVPGAHAAR